MPPTAYAKMNKELRRKKKRGHGTRAQRIETQQNQPGGLCGARKKNGSGTCTMAAGWGTEHYGYGRCKLHGGASPGANTKAVKDNAVAEYRGMLGQPVEVNPLDALLMCIKITAGEVQWFTEQLEKITDKDDYIEIDDHGKRELHTLARSRGVAVERLAKFSRDAVSLGLAERAVRLAEQYGETLARLIRGITDDLELTAKQKEMLPGIVRRHLLALEGAAPVTEKDRKALVKQAA